MDQFYTLTTDFTTSTVSKEGPRGGAVGWGTALQAGRPRVRFLMMSSEFFIDCGSGVDSVSNRNEYQEYFLVSKGGRCVGLTILPPSYAGFKSGSLSLRGTLYKDCFTFPFCSTVHIWLRLFFYILFFDLRLPEDDLRRSKHVAVLADCVSKFTIKYLCICLYYLLTF